MTQIKVTFTSTTFKYFPEKYCGPVKYRPRIKLARGLDKPCSERIIKLLFTYFLSFWRLITMAAEQKSGLTNAQLIMCKVLNAAQGKKTIDELAIDYGKLMKKEIAASSMTTNMSLLRKAIHKEGKVFPKSWEPKHKSGGGRTSVRTSLDDVLNSMGVVLEDLPEGESESESEGVAAE